MSIADRNDTLYATVSKEVKQEIKELADKEKRTLSQQVAYILENYLAERANTSKVNGFHKVPQP